MEIQKVKISDLPVTEDLNGLKTLGTTAENTSKAAELTFIADAATSANEAATNANQAAENANTSAANADAKAEAAQKAADNATASANQADQAAVNANTATTRATAAAEKAENAADVAIGVVNEAQQATANANQAAQSANEAATNANQAATSANDAATEAHTQAEYAKTQGDYAKAEGDRVLAEKGQPGGLAELDESGRVPSSQLPSYVDDVINVATYSQLPNPGESGKIYITEDTNLTYRWSGTGYAEISPSLALGTTAETAGRGDWTQAAYNHSLIKDGSNPHKTTFASLPDKPTSLPANGGNADTVDNLHASSFTRADQSPNVDLNTVNGQGIMACGLNEFATAERHYPIQQAGTLFYGTAAYNSACQIYGTFQYNRWFVRGGGTSQTAKTPWAEIWTTVNFNPGNYLPLSGGKTITGNVALANEVMITNQSGGNLIGLRNGLSEFGDAGHATQIVSNDSDLQHWRGGQNTIIYDSSNFNPDSKFNNLDNVNDSDNVVGNGYTIRETGSSFSGPFLKWGKKDYMIEFFTGNNINDIRIRNMFNGVWGDSVKMYHSGNLGNATTSKAGLMSAADKTKLDGLSGGGLNIPASGEVAISGWMYNGKQVYAQRWTGSLGSGFNTTVASQINISAFLSLYGDIKLGSYNYPIGSSVWNRSTGEDMFKSSFIYGKGVTNNLSIEHWTAQGATAPTTYEVFAVYTK